MANLNWYYQELRQVGTDFTDSKQVETYDRNMGGREEEIQDVIKKLKLSEADILLEVGTGTGEIGIGVAKYCKQVIAVDISQTMLNYANKKAINRQVNNISFQLGGFLSFTYNGAPISRIVTHFALHHIPDFWKSVAIKRLYDLLAPGGKLYLRDVVFSFAVEDYEQSINAWIEHMSTNLQSFKKEEWEIHVRDEYSTYNWILDSTSAISSVTAL